MQKPLNHMSRRRLALPIVVIALTLGILGAALLLVSLNLRQKIRSQIISRDSQVVNAVALVQQYAQEVPEELDSLIEGPLDQLAAILETARLPNVMAVRLFDAQGRFVTALPADVTEAQLAAPDLAQLKALKMVSHYYAKANLADQFLLMPDESSQANPQAPLLEVIIPLYPKTKTRFVGAAQFLLDGQHIGEEFATLNKNLWGHLAAAFLAGSVAITGALGWAFRRLQQANRLLAERTAHLLRANHELTLAAKTSALGTVTAHLIHGLKNPLSGLQTFVASRGQESAAQTDVDWQDAITTTRRMQSLVNDIVRVLHEENGISHYEITLAELIELVAARTRPAAHAAGVDFQTRLNTNGALSNRDANLVMLILENLLQNALEATAKGKLVRLEVFRSSQGIVFKVQDEGPGLPDSAQKNLFMPCRSAKTGGSGIGLALSKQLAAQLEADLALKSSSPQGCVFALILPAHKISQ
jgi:signal transduction histidine kinase